MTKPNYKQYAAMVPAPIKEYVAGLIDAMIEAELEEVLIANQRLMTDNRDLRFALDDAERRLTRLETRYTNRDKTSLTRANLLAALNDLGVQNDG